MEHIQHGQAHAHNGQVEIGRPHGLLHLLGRPGDKAAQNHPPERQHHRRDHQRGGRRDGQRRPGPLPDAPVPPRAQVLAHIGNGVAVGGGGNLQHAVQLVGGGEPRDEHHAGAVDHKLHDHAAHGNDAVLEGHGEAQPQQIGGHPLLEAQVGPAQPQHLQLPHVVQAEQAGQRLGDQRGRRRPGDAPLEHHHEQQIQRNIGRRGHRHGLERRFPVPQGAQHAGQQVIGHHHRDAQVHDAQVQKRVPQNVPGGLQEHQHRPRRQLPRPRQQQGKQGGQHPRVADHVPQPGVVPRAELPGHADGAALGEALHNAQHHPVHPVRGPQRGQRAHAQVFSHHHGVHHGIQLLEHIAHHQGQREAEDQLPRSPLRHVLDASRHAFPILSCAAGTPPCVRLSYHNSSAPRKTGSRQKSPPGSRPPFTNGPGCGKLSLSKRRGRRTTLRKGGQSHAAQQFSALAQRHCIHLSDDGRGLRGQADAPPGKGAHPALQLPGIPHPAAADALYQHLHVRYQVWGQPGLPGAGAFGAAGPVCPHLALCQAH